MRTFEEELAEVINRHSVDAECNTPDYVLARYIKDILGAYSKSVKLREKDETVKMLQK